MKRVVTMIMVFILMSVFTVSSANNGIYADKLSEIGVFKGTGNGYELDRMPSRLEGLIMFVRLLGKEDEALLGSYEHPFEDVPSWAKGYVGWAYNKGYTSGISDTEFGTGAIQAKSYLTFILRALGYSDTGGDFSWGKAIDFSTSIGLINAEMKNEYESQSFLRDHVARLSYDALSMTMKGNDKKLYEKLIETGAISEEKMTNILGDKTGVESVPELSIIGVDEYLSVPNLNEDKIVLFNYGDKQDLIGVGASSAAMDFIGTHVDDGKIEYLHLHSGVAEHVKNLPQVVEQYMPGYVGFFDPSVLTESQSDSIYQEIIDSLNLSDYVYSKDANFGQENYSIDGKNVMVGRTKDFSLSLSSGINYVTDTIHHNKRYSVLGTEVFVYGLMDDTKPYNDKNLLQSSNGEALASIVIIQDIEKVGDAALYQMNAMGPKLILIQCSQSELNNNRVKFEVLKTITKNVYASSEAGDIQVVFKDNGFELITENNSTTFVREEPAVDISNVDEIESINIDYIESGSTLGSHFEWSNGDKTYMSNPEESMKFLSLDSTSIPLKLSDWSHVRLYQLVKGANPSFKWVDGVCVLDEAFNCLSIDKSNALDNMYMYQQGLSSDFSKSEYLGGNGGNHFVAQDFINILVIYDENGIPVAYQYI